MEFKLVRFYSPRNYINFGIKVYIRQKMPILILTNHRYLKYHSIIDPDNTDSPMEHLYYSQY